MSDHEKTSIVDLMQTPEAEVSIESNTHLGYPEAEECGSGTIPPIETNPAEKQTIQLPDLVSIWKYLLNRNYGNQRLTLYSYLNRLLHNGVLSDIVGFNVMNRVINKEVLQLVDATFWKIDRSNFYAHISVELTLQMLTGTRKWTGYLICWCSFQDEGFSCSVEDLVSQVEEDESLVRLNPFLVPYYTSRHMDDIAEKIWVKYGLSDALTHPSLRNAKELAHCMGLSIQYLPVYEHKGVNSILFFTESELLIGEDRMVCREHGEKAHLKTGNVQTVTIPSNTIVINTNKIPKDYSCFNIYHECIHFELHYMFFRLQQMGSNDVRQIKVKRVEVEKGKEYHDPIYFMEKQADRGAYGLIMPRTHTQKMIADECEQATGYQNFGEKYEMVGKRIADTLCLPHFRVRARMIQLGHMEARGALNYVNSRLIHPFAFDPNAWKENEISFVIDPGSVKQLRKECEDLQKLMVSDKYIYADGHVVRNEPRFVTVQQEEAQLTDEARKQVDLCCLRFIRRYVQKDVGQYVYGRMFYDPHYVEQTEFYLSDLINLKQMDDLDAKMEYKDSFPRTFVKAFDMLMKKNGETRETIAPKLHTTDRSLHEWLYDPERKITADFVVGISLMWQVPDWISQMLLDRAGIHMSEFNRRHQALEYIRTVLWDKGVEEANAYLKSKGLAPLAI